MRFFAALIIVASAFAQHAGAPAEPQFKNLIQLKDAPPDQIQPAMAVIAASLGVDCTFCHVQGNMAADDKAPKKTAREMMAMTAMINKNAFNGRQQITCYSCHRGATRPVSIAPVLDSDTMPAAPKPAPVVSASAPTADQIVERYLSAAGGADAIRKINSRVMTGSVHSPGGDSPIQLYTKAPNKRISISKMGNADSLTAFDGTIGWLGTTGRPAREMSATEAAAANLDAQFSLALSLKELYPQLRRGRPEEVNGAMCEVLTGNAAGKPSIRLDFDQKTGLLQRMVRYADTPVGRNPTQVDYADYRTVDGVTIPFRWTLSRVNGRFTIQLSDVKQNVPVDDAKFTKPSGEVK